MNKSEALPLGEAPRFRLQKRTFLPLLSGIRRVVVCRRGAPNVSQTMQPVRFSSVPALSARESEALPLGKRLAFVLQFFFSVAVMRVQNRPVAMSQMRRLSASLTTTPPTVMVCALMNSESS